jgi:hypothetical protein
MAMDNTFIFLLLWWSLDVVSVGSKKIHQTNPSLGLSNLLCEDYRGSNEPSNEPSYDSVYS